MLAQLEYVVVAAFLLWGLVASLCGVLMSGADLSRLVSRRRGGSLNDTTPPDPIDH